MDKIFDLVADGLAEQGFAIINHFLSIQEVENIVSAKEFKDNANQFKKAGIGKKLDLQINESIRGDYIHWLDRKNTSSEVSIYLDRLQNLVQYLNQSLYLSLKDVEVHSTIYPAGTYYKRHLDQFKADDHRKLSVICYLNLDWNESNGGELRMYLPDQSLDVLPTAGKLVCFRSDQIEHEVLPSNKERLSLTGWVLDQLAELKHL